MGASTSALNAARRACVRVCVLIGGGPSPSLRARSTCFHRHATHHNGVIAAHPRLQSRPLRQHHALAIIAHHHHHRHHCHPRPGTLIIPHPHLDCQRAHHVAPLLLRRGRGVQPSLEHGAVRGQGGRARGAGAGPQEGRGRQCVHVCVWSWWWGQRVPGREAAVMCSCCPDGSAKKGWYQDG